MNLIKTKLLVTSSSNLADILTIVNPIGFGGLSSKVKVMMGIIDMLSARGCYALRCYISFYFDMS